MSDFNTQIIEEFRANDGRVGGMFKGVSLLLLHTIGVKSGKERINPLAYQSDGDRYVIFASFAGSPANPAWYHNLVAHPDVTVEVGTDRFPVHARVAEGDERDRLWARQKELVPTFADYQRKTTRPIPVIVLERSER